MNTKLYILDQKGNLTTWWRKFITPFNRLIVDYRTFCEIRDEQLLIYHARINSNYLHFSSEEYMSLFLLKFS